MQNEQWKELFLRLMGDEKKSPHSGDIDPLTKILIAQAVFSGVLIQKLVYVEFLLERIAGLKGVSEEEISHLQSLAKNSASEILNSLLDDLDNLK